MCRRPRRIPPNSLVEVTCRTVGELFLLRPSKETNDIIGGILARYAAKHGVLIIAPVFMSNHFHLLVFVEDAQQLAAFMRDVNREISKEIGLLHEWNRQLWKRRYDAIPVADEEAAYVDRLTYLLSHGVKENLVEKAQHWPGIHAARLLLEGEPVRGTWRDRTREGRQKRSARKPDPSSFLFEEVLELAKLPCWSHLSDEQYRARIAEIVQDAELAAGVRREREGKTCLGRNRILGQDPLGAPKNSKCSPKPLFHAISKKVREAMRQAFKAFFDAYLVASADYRAGKLGVVFPEGSFPPALPFFGSIRAGPTAAGLT